MKYGYARVSTKGQKRDGNGLEVQREQLISAGAEKVFFEAYTGTKMSRPELEKLFSEVQSGDEVIVTKLDRIARSVRDGIDIIEKFNEMGVGVNILNMGKLDMTPTGKLMRNIFFAFAEFERDMIVTRTQEGKAICREDPSWREGRKRIEVGAEIMRKHFEDVHSGVESVADACRELQICKKTWYNKVREYKIF